MSDFNVKKFKITFLGTSSASISPRSSTSASLVEVGRTRIIVDAGIGALRQLLKTGSSPDIIDAVLITHWHLDHFAGLLRLIRRRKNPAPLPIYGPMPQLSTRIFLRTAFQSVFQYFNFFKESCQIDLPDICASTFNTVHKTPSVGWILTESPVKARRVVFSGDTRPAKEIIKAACKTDLLIHEATYLEQHSLRAISQRHSTAAEAANLAVKSGAGGLALTHIPSRYSLSAVRNEVEIIFPGVIIPHPMVTISVDPQLDELKNTGFGWAKLKILDNYAK
jgi:ribonuclease Z